MLAVAGIASGAPPPRWGQERRIEFIDFRLHWDGTVNRGELMQFFRISPQQASADLAVYMERAPNNIEYDRRLKVYKATADFSPLSRDDDAQSYLSQLTGLAVGHLSSTASFIGWRPPHDLVRHPARPVKSDTLLRIIWAIRDGSALKILYQSMRRAGPTSRWIAPHALAHDGQRWHARAWCEESNEFRDFVLSRIQRIDAFRKSDVPSSADNGWQDFVDVMVAPRDGLTVGQRKAIELDFGMTDGQLRLRCRKALAFYLLRQMNLERADYPLSAQPLQLLNRDDLRNVIDLAEKRPEYLNAELTME